MLGQVCISIPEAFCRALSIRAKALRAELLFARPARGPLCAAACRGGGSCGGLLSALTAAAGKDLAEKQLLHPPGSGGHRQVPFGAGCRQPLSALLIPAPCWVQQRRD